jgi:hypothetical protein
VTSGWQSEKKQSRKKETHELEGKREINKEREKNQCEANKRNQIKEDKKSKKTKRFDKK